MDYSTPLTMSLNNAPSPQWCTPVVVGCAISCVMASTLVLFSGTTNSNNVMHYTVGPSVTRVTKLPQMTAPLASRAGSSHLETSKEHHNMVKYVPVHETSASGSWARSSNQNQGPSPLPWLALPSMMAVFGYLMGRAFARKENPIKTEGDVALTPISSGKLPFSTSVAKERQFVGRVKALKSQPRGLVVANTKTAPTMQLRHRIRPGYEEEQPIFMNKLNELFPGAMPETTFIAKATKLMNDYGFNKDNSIGLLSVCRDEVTRTLVEDFEELWGPSFSSGSLAGMAFLGKTGMGAGMAHAPQCEDGVERYIFLSAPHIAISVEGEVGKLYRAGRENISSACGALIAMQSELQNGRVGVQMNTMDMELTMMKQQLSEKIRYGYVPTLDELTKNAQQLIKSQMEGILSQMNLTGRTEYCFLSGVQIHGPDNADFFWPTDMYVVRLDGGRIDVDLKDLQNTNVSGLLQELEFADLAKLLFVIQKGDAKMVKRWVEENGGDVNSVSAEGTTPLIVAARYGHYEIVRYLLAKGADASVKSKRGRTALQVAMEYGHEAVVNGLLTAGDVLDHEVAQFYLWRGVREGDLSLVKRALRCGPEGLINDVNTQGDRPVFASVRLNKMNVARWLIAFGADTTGIDMDGNNISDMATRRGIRELAGIVNDSAESTALQDLLEATKALDQQLADAHAELMVLREQVQPQGSAAGSGNNEPVGIVEVKAVETKNNADDCESVKTDETDEKKQRVSGKEIFFFSILDEEEGEEAAKVRVGQKE